MKRATPKIDGRTFDELLRQSQALAPSYTPEWTPGQRHEAGQALLNIYLRLQEQVLARLNRAPDKNFVAFLDMMGMKLLPAQSARARVTFKLTTGATEHVLVPKGTLLSGEAADGGGQVVFQTQQDLLVTPAALQRLFSYDVSDDSVYEHTPEDPQEPQPFTVFADVNLQEHSLYLGHADLLNQQKPTTIAVEFVLSEPASDGSDLDLVWEFFDGARWAEIVRFTRNAATGAFDDDDATRLFTRSGVMTLVKNQTAEIAEKEVGGVTSRWIRCRLIRKLSGDRPVKLPTVNTVRVSVRPLKSFAPDLAFNNDIPLNLAGLGVEMLARASDFGFAEKSPPAGAARTIIRMQGHEGNLFVGDFLALNNLLDDVEVREVVAINGAEVTLNHALRFDYDPTTGAKVSLFTALRPDETDLETTSPENLEPLKGSRATLFSNQKGEGAEITEVKSHPASGSKPPSSTLTLKRDATPSKPFYQQGDLVEITPRLHPFGKLPVAFDTFYIASDEAFSKKGAQITLDINAEWNESGSLPNPPPNPVLSWEYWNGKSWRGIRVVDTTDRFKNKNAKVTFKCPTDIEKVEVNGEEKFWIRVRIIDGDYGREIVLVPKGGTQVDIVAGKIHFPIISDLLISYEDVGEPPQSCLTRNNLNTEDHTAANLDLNRKFAPFAAMPEPSPALFLGFDKALRGGPLSILFDLEEQFLDQDARVKVLWSYWNGRAWQPLNLEDETESLTKVGVLEFLVGRDFAALRLFGHDLFWLKGSFAEGERPPLLVKSLHPNTTSALQADVADNELAGSSKGTADQVFTLQHPLVISQQVFVREPLAPTEEERADILRDEGRDAITINTNELGETTEILVRWHAVEDFDDSGPQSRHYTVDQRLGKLQFGDGDHGMVPPAGADNVIVSYTFGGGKSGNVPVKAISGLKSAVPFVNAVTNHLPADGGSETEKLDDVLARGPLLLKNRNRAVTPEDFEALARDASRKVARAKCLPNTDEEGDAAPGWVTVLIVPDSDEAAPRPTRQLIGVVKEGLERRSANVVSSPRRVHVKGPEYVEVIVEVTVVPTSLDTAAAAETSLRAKLNRRIHPLTGGPCGTGWEFGRPICFSEIIALCESVEDVDHVEKIALLANGRAYEGDVPLDAHTLPVSGEHRISLALDGARVAADPCRTSKTECAPRQEFTLKPCPDSAPQPAPPPPAQQPEPQPEQLSGEDQ